MRHLVFGLVLAAAAFAGGALVNGPGLAWVRQNVIGGPTVVTDGGTAPAGRPARRFPTANSSPLLLGDLPPSPAPPSTLVAPPAAPPAGPPALATSTPAPASVAAQLPPPSTAAPAGPLLESNPSGIEAASPPLELPGDPAPKADLTTRLASGAEATAGTSALGASPGGIASPDTAAAAGDWAALRARLRELGASRYSVEADLAGRVRFSCVIPVEGLRAVGHHFEAEGDDEFQAAEATIRRVTLWRATEATHANP